MNLEDMTLNKVSPRREILHRLLRRGGVTIMLRSSEQGSGGQGFGRGRGEQYTGHEVSGRPDERALCTSTAACTVKCVDVASLVFGLLLRERGKQGIFGEYGMCLLPPLRWVTGFA